MLNREIVQSPIEIARDMAHVSPFANFLYRQDWISLVYLGTNFVTTSLKRAELWDMPTANGQKPAERLRQTIDTYLRSGHAIMDQPKAGDVTNTNKFEAAEEFVDEADENVCVIKELITSRINSAIARDGGEMKFIGLGKATHKLYVSLLGACNGCPSTTTTLTGQALQFLQHYQTGVTAIINLTPSKPVAKPAGFFSRIASLRT